MLERLRIFHHHLRVIVYTFILNIMTCQYNKDCSGFMSFLSHYLSNSALRKLIESGFSRDVNVVGLIVEFNPKVQSIQSVQVSY